MNRKETIYNAIVGVLTNGSVIVLDDIFEYDGGFKGATYYAIETLTQDTIDYHNSDDEFMSYAKEVWQDAVATDNTTDSLDDFAELIKQDMENNGLYYCYDDPSFRNRMDDAYEDLSPQHKDALNKIIGVKGKDFVDWESSSCGRIGDNIYSWEWKVVFRPDLVEKIKEYEGEKI